MKPHKNNLRNQKYFIVNKEMLCLSDFYETKEEAMERFNFLSEKRGDIYLANVVDPFIGRRPK